MGGNSVLLIIGGGIAAYKSLETIRRLRERGVTVRAILTTAGAALATPLSVSALTGEKVFDDPFSLTDEAQMGHIQLSRAADPVGPVGPGIPRATQPLSGSDPPLDTPSRRGAQTRSANSSLPHLTNAVRVRPWREAVPAGRRA